MKIYARGPLKEEFEFFVGDSSTSGEPTVKTVCIFHGDRRFELSVEKIAIEADDEEIIEEEEIFFSVFQELKDPQTGDTVDSVPLYRALCY